MSNCKKCGLPIEEGQEYCADCMPTEEVQAEVVENQVAEPVKGGKFTKISEGLAIAATVLFVVGQLLGFIPVISYISFIFSFPAFPLAIAALVFGIIAMTKKEGKLGLILGIVALVLQVVIGTVVAVVGIVVGVIIGLIAAMGQNS